MGRRNRNGSSRSTPPHPTSTSTSSSNHCNHRAVPLPNDGPLHWFLLHLPPEQERSSDANDLFDREALALLTRAIHSSPAPEDIGIETVRVHDPNTNTNTGTESGAGAGTPEDPFPFPSSSSIAMEYRLVEALVHAETMPQQIQLLQEFRQTWLLLRLRWEQESLERKPQQREPRTPHPRASSLYSLLLEWRVSKATTPVALQHAIDCVLVALVTSHPTSTCDPNDTLPLQAVQQAVQQQAVQQRRILTSLLLCMHQTCEYWNDPMHVARELLCCCSASSSSKSTPPTPPPKQPHPPLEQEDLMVEQWVDFLEGCCVSNSCPLQQPSEPRRIKVAVEIAHLCSQVLTQYPNTALRIRQRKASTFESLRLFHWRLLTCPQLPLDHVLKVGLATGRIELCVLENNNIMSKIDIDRADRLLDPFSSSSMISIMPASQVVSAAWLHALAACLPVSIVFGDMNKNHTTDTLPLFLLERLLDALCDVAQTATNLDARYFALKGLRTLTSRCCPVPMNHSNEYKKEEEENEKEDANDTLRSLVVDRVLDVVLSAWQYPTYYRKIETALPSLFRQVLALSRCYRRPSSWHPHPSNPPPENTTHDSSPYSSSAVNNNFSLEDVLMERILQQPKHSKGRYLALETLLEVFDHHDHNRRESISMSQRLFSSSNVCDDLLLGIAEGGHNAIAMSDLLSKLLERILARMYDRNQEAATAAATVAAAGGDHHHRQRSVLLLQAWMNLWIPRLVHCLTTSELSRRKQVTALFFPRMTKTVGKGAAHRQDVALILIRILNECSRLMRNDDDNEDRSALACPTSSIFHSLSTAESKQDRIAWVQLQTASFAMHERLLDESKVGNAAVLLQECIVRYLPISFLRQALIHFSASIRMSAFLAIEAVAWSDVSQSFATSQDCRKPLDNNEHLRLEFDFWTTSLPFAIKEGGLEYTVTIVHCLLSYVDRLSAFESIQLSSVKDRSDQSLLKSSMLLSFASFLINDLVCKRGSYPGTTFDKEIFSLTVLEGLLVFSFRQHPLARASKLIPKTGSIYQRRRTDFEDSLLNMIRQSLVHDEVIFTLISLIHSMWDTTRSTAFMILTNLIQASCAQENAILVSVLRNDTARSEIEHRAIFLASSPRQRESDSGARLLAILRLLAELPDLFLRRIVDLFELRIDSMSLVLQRVLEGEMDRLSSLPLAHGIVQSLHLMQVQGCTCVTILQRVVKLLCRAIKLALTVIADLQEVEFGSVYREIEQFDESCVLMLKKTVNPGAIGANGTISSVQRATYSDRCRQFASQRVIVGCWLLTKECCNALSTCLSSRGNLSFTVYNDAGKILIGTLVSLKHAGAAYESHKALQRLTLTCMKHENAEIQRLPSQWIDRLLRDISGSERLVRNSILRRSTGYALGVLSILRSEVSFRSSPRPLCQSTLSFLLRLALPSDAQLRSLLMTACNSKVDRKSFFSFITSDSSTEMDDDCSRTPSTRVHALNILRAAILDAPLACEVFPLAGDAIASAILGYLDPQWAVRNSATMVFSSVMLRVIDADKNASNADPSSTRAVTIVELFRSYPRLYMFLQVLLERAVQNRSSPSRSYQPLPPELPIMLLFSRVQSAAFSGSEVEEIIAPFWPSMMSSLSHPSLLVREAAARALSNLSLENKTSELSARRLLMECLADWNVEGKDWNRFHGSLLTVSNLLNDRKDVRSECTIIARRLQDTIFHLCDINNIRRVPPSCVKCALELLVVCDCSHVICTTFRIKDQIENNQEWSGGAFAVGRTVGFVATDQLCSELWNTCIPSFESLHTCLDRQSSLFQSPLFNIRLVSVKGFKKRSLRGLTALRNLSDRKPAKYVIDTITRRLLLPNIIVEMSRDKSDDIIGSHPPTLRRLSRCLIDSLVALLDVADEPLTSDLQEAIIDVAFTCIGDVENTSLDSVITNLTGNGIELLGLALRHRPLSEINPEMIVTYRKLLLCLSDPNQTWKSRHSAAVSLWTSDVLGKHHHVDVAVLDIDSFLEIAICLSQDNDKDVRSVGSRILVVASATQCTNIVFLPQPEFALCRIQGTSGFALLQAIRSSSGLEDKLAQIRFEMDADCNHSSMELQEQNCALINANYNRPIFEEESPCTYLESCLLTQILLSELVKSETLRNPQSKLFCDSHEDEAELLLERCRAVLNTLGAMYLRNQGRLGTYDFARDARIMALLHNLFLGTSAVLLIWNHHHRLSLSGHPRPDSPSIAIGSAAESTMNYVSMVASEILSHLSSKERSVYPIIRQVVQAVALPDAAVFNRACFLLFNNRKCADNIKENVQTASNDT